MLVLASILTKIEVGKSYVNQHVTNPQGEKSSLSFRVVREATRREYEQSIREHKGKSIPDYPGTRYFEVEAD
jgi:hypothetical protein